MTYVNHKALIPTKEKETRIGHIIIDPPNLEGKTQVTIIENGISQIQSMDFGKALETMFMLKATYFPIDKDRSCK